MATPKPDPRRLSAYQVRRLIDDLLRTDGDLQAFLVDEFRDVQKRFSAEMTRERRVSLLFEVVGEQEVADHLAARDPVAFEKALARLPQHVPPIPAPPPKQRALLIALGLLGALAVAGGTYRLVRPLTEPAPQIVPTGGDQGLPPSNPPPAPKPIAAPDLAVVHPDLAVIPPAQGESKKPVPSQRPAVQTVTGRPPMVEARREGTATCHATRCELSGVTRAELGDSLICLDPQSPDDPSRADGLQPTCTLSAGSGPPVCFRSDEQAQRVLLGSIRWRTPCP